ncbi:MAG TPA: 2,3-bisphosphoglycerate-independent phosphoglycerate mutase [Coriobacteriia bacterium]|nr:2,3-bisphosphoglycerate-independent phosphoglycerate mutase [Coriobacteriia bacterium]
MKNLPVALMILDGFGLGVEEPGNAVRAANAPHLHALFEDNPNGLLSASGLAVGLPEGQMGNSEVGHLNIGAGRVVYQELTRIDLAIQDGSLFDNEVIGAAIDAAVAEGKAVHFMGLVSPGGVHSHQNHLYALVDMARQRGASTVWVHCLLDGRDTPPQSGLGYVRELEAKLERIGVGTIATVMGRYYAMDRDNRWDRVEKAWRALVLGEGVPADSADSAIEASYATGVNDEFVVPAIVEPARLAEGDAFVFFNFRPDRAREITRSLTDATFEGFERPVYPALRFVCLTEYDPTIPAPVAFPKAFPANVLADALAANGLRQLHIAETEKYAHVTFFLNGGVETPKAGETRVLVPSPKVATYDLKPEMSAPEVTDKLVEAIEGDAADVYIVNYANCDMVGHTGVFEAAVKAVEAVDEAVGRVLAAIAAKGGSVILTADHGNAEHMVDADNVTPFTAHTTSTVPIVVVSPGVKGIADGGKLADVAPTLAALIGMEQPQEWTGHSLLLY